MSSSSSIKDETKPHDAASNHEEQPSSPNAEFNPGWRFYLAFLSLTTITLMVALDATSLSVALPIMAKLLNGSAIQAFWSGTSFLLTSTVFQPIIGSFSSIFGRVPMLWISLTFFGAGAIVAAVANNFTVILVGRSIQGVGGGGIIALTEIIVTDMVPLRLRGQWFSFISAAWAVGTVAGPLLGGGFSQNVSWRWIFYINLPFIGVGAIMIAFFLRLNFRTTTFTDKLRQIDWIGTFLFIASSTGFLMGISWGGVMYPWNHWRTLVPLIVCAGGLVAFGFYEEWLSRRGRQPLIPLEVLKNRTAASTYFGTFVHGMLLWCILYYLPFYYEGIKGYSNIKTGVALFPLTFTVAPASVIAGVIAAKTGRYRESLWLGWILTVFGMGLLIYLDVNTSTPAWIFLLLVGGVGTGILFTALALATQAASSTKNQSYAVILLALFRSFGQTAGVAIGGVVFQNLLKKKLLSFPSLAEKASQYSQDSSSLVEVIKAMPAGKMKQDLLESYMHGLRGIFIMCTALAGAALIASFWARALPLDRALETDQGFQHKEKKGDEEKRNSSSS